MMHQQFGTLEYLGDASTPTVGLRKNFAQMAGGLILRAAGEDLKREGLERTPARFAKAIDELCSGYRMTVEEALGEGVFQAEGSGLVTVKDVEFYSLCEHHILPFWGKISVAYYPTQKIVGLSKIPRLVDLFSRRLQVQERLTHEVAQALWDTLKPRAVAVKATGAHMCMMMRGVKKQASETSTEASFGIGSLSEVEQTRIWKSLD